ncbi:MAG TPA: protein-L-isoaspartate(D-aspartate) O-methyltransferase [Terriglobales bacterium]|nr:protein-L-isoaspartate(D-aspartate) O-methyltransferase [Terriglobales bacterium]
MPADAQVDAYAAPRAAMVQLQLRQRGIRDERVLEAMLRVPRHLFVPPEFGREAYADTPVPIGEGQTISQPFIIAYMLQALALTAQDRVLEIGTGSGYQTALLGELVSEVYSVERYATLLQRARAALDRLGYRNIVLIQSDGSEGYSAAAPYDAITVGAAAPEIPPALFQQLREGGQMILPVGPPDMQVLQLVHKRGQDALISELEGCRFVPLIGKQGFPERPV